MPPCGLPRFVEILLAAAGLLLSFPILIVSAAAIALTSGRPVVFRQTRIGRGGKPFVLLKLRTMRPSDGLAVTARDDPRVTTVGRFLRAIKLDEVPQLWNVVRGELSLVGPRPEVPEYVDLSASTWREILRVRPGLTDPVTLRLRDEESLLAGVTTDRDRYYREVLQPRKLDGYIAYLRQRSAWGDVGILLKTVLTIACHPFARRLPPSDLPQGPARP